MILKVAVPGIFLDPLDYLADDSEIYTPGQRVLVPLRNKQVCGIIFGTSNNSNFSNKLKAIIKVIDAESYLNKPYINLLSWLAKYYHYPIYRVCEAALPTKFLLGEQLSYPGKIVYQKNQIDYLAIVDNIPKNAIKQKELLQYLLDNDQMNFSRESLADFSLALLKKAENNKWLKTIYLSENPENNNIVVSREFSLNDEQQNAIHFLTATNYLSKFSVTLLYGVTGSGKTEVYIETIKQVVASNKQVLLLVPEISLTPQTIERIQKRFKQPTTTLNSGLTLQEKQNRWAWINEGKVAIIVSTRSGLFSCFNNLGLIVIDEEHDSSYKQQSNLRYHARDTSIMLAKYTNIPIILGTATPSSETYLNVLNNKYHLLYLKSRASTLPPSYIRLINISNLKLFQGISQPLLSKIEDTLEQDKQTLLFINRRGYAQVLMCHECGWIAECKRCESPYTLHLHPQQNLVCHYCNSYKAIDTNCPKCNSCQLITAGIATEKVEEFLKNRFPNKNILRMDRTNITNKDDLENALELIHSNWANIIIGTQMITKGHHFKNVTLVGILDGDSGLFSSDYHAIEKMSQQIIQVSGRSGREQHQGEVYLQTHQPDHPMLKLLLEQGYEVFIKNLLTERKQHNWPPYSYQAIIRVDSHQFKAGKEFLNEIKNLKFDDSSNITIYGPTNANRAKQSGYYRQILLLQSQFRNDLHSFIYNLQRKINTKLRWIIDIDPIDLH
jgi:primosomal protein N' (replication factor Y)